MFVSAPKQQSPNQTHQTFRSPFRLMIIVAIVVFTAEMSVMFLLSVLSPYSSFAEAIIDSTLLLLLIFPALYFFFFRPMWHHIHERQLVESELQRERDTLDERVKERSTELVVINRELEKEVIARRKTEEHLRKFSMIAEQSPNSILIKKQKEILNL